MQDVGEGGEINYKKRCSIKKTCDRLMDSMMNIINGREQEV